MSITIKDNTDEFLSAFEKALENGLTAIGMTAEGHAKRKITSYPAVVNLDGKLRTTGALDEGGTLLYDEVIKIVGHKK